MKHRIRRLVNLAGALIAAALVMFLLAAGTGAVPALGQALNPGRGVWAGAAAAQLPHSETLSIPGLHGPARISFDSAGVATVKASDDADLFLAQGYVTARFRLSQMDLERRLGEGRLAELNGPGSVDSDTFELTLGLQRTAEAEWAQTPRDSPAGTALTAYAQGVNDWLKELRGSQQWPAVYALTGVRPRDWTPVDSLVVQAVLAQQLSFTSEPLDYSILSHSLGEQRASAWFPVLPPTPQAAYDPGPYRYLGIDPITAVNANAAAPGAATAVAASAAPATRASTTADPDAAAVGVSAALTRIASLPQGLRHIAPDSNAWAANGPAVSGGVSMLAGDPHLALSLPSFWFQVALKSPGFDVTGASLVGLPAVLIGHNQHVSWTLTDVQNQSVLYYTEQTDSSHPDSYYWKGAWRPVQKVHYTVPVLQGATVRLDVGLTVHGPLLTEKGQTVAVYWTGNLPSPDVAALLSIDRSTDAAGFRTALRDWHAPTQNFVYADDRGGIGILAPGYYPQVAHGDPRAPLPGTGADDVVGTIPPAAVPQVQDPASHVVATANQRPVDNSYPYYLGPAEMFDQGYRANTIYAALDGRQGMGLSDFTALQNNVHDPLAAELVPELLAALKGQSLTAQQQSAAALLGRWNDSMDTDSAAASVWWQFLHEYVGTVFGSWWTSAGVPVKTDAELLDLKRNIPVSLMQDLESWTLHDPSNAAFTPPGKAARTADQAMREAFTTAVAGLSRQLGGTPSGWSWGKLHSRVVPSLLGPSDLGYGPFPSGGEPWTVNAADDGLESDFGPSWRMAVRWTAPGRSEGEAIYPGGQSEDPASPWYDNFAPLWLNGRYRPLLTADQSSADGVVWTLRTGK